MEPVVTKGADVDDIHCKHMRTSPERPDEQRAASRGDSLHDVAGAIRTGSRVPHVPADADLARAVRNVLVWHPLVPNQRITSTVSNGWVTLQGTVDNDYQRNDAAHSVLGIPGVQGVTNELVTGAPDSEATEVQQRIRAALAGWAELEGDRMHVTAHPDGSMTVSGIVDSEATRAVALKAARLASRGKDVDDHLRIAPALVLEAAMGLPKPTTVPSSFLSEGERDDIRNRLDDLPSPVRLLVFADGGCASCQPLLHLAEELASLCSEVTLEVIDPSVDRVLASLYDIAKLPAIALLTGGVTIEDSRIRFYGCPRGELLKALLDDIITVSSRHSRLTPATQAWLASVDQPLHLQVFANATCPGGVQAITLAHRFAIGSRWVHADVLVATEYPQIAARYHAGPGPLTVINESLRVEGTLAEDRFLEVLRVAAAGAPRVVWSPSASPKPTEGTP